MKYVLLLIAFLLSCEIDEYDDSIRRASTYVYYESSYNGDLVFITDFRGSEDDIQQNKHLIANRPMGKQTCPSWQNHVRLSKCKLILDTDITIGNEIVSAGTDLLDHQLTTFRDYLQADDRCSVFEVRIRVPCTVWSQIQFADAEYTVELYLKTSDNLVMRPITQFHFINEWTSI